MTSGAEWLRWLRDADVALDGARRGWRDRAWRDTCLLGQLAIEMSAKAVIAAFVEPEWTHDPGRQMRLAVLPRPDAELDALLGPDAREAITRLARDASESAVWHGRAAYGQKLDDDTWLAAVDVCTEEAARELLARAEHAVAVASRLRTPNAESRTPHTSCG
jgi:hypothetical protein